MLTRLISAEDPSAISQALQALKRGQVVAFPTDTVYGIGTLVHSVEGIDRLFAVKGREADKAIPVLLGDPQALSQVAHSLGSIAMRLAERFWPGPLTLVVPRHSSLPANLSTEATIGVRMPDHVVALALLRAAGPLAVTSANLSGGANCATASEVMAQLGGRIDIVLDGGRTPGGVPSTVVDCTGAQPRILRAGPLSLQEILSALA